jgi:hypothetical protein
MFILSPRPFHHVIPAKAGIQFRAENGAIEKNWIPTFLPRRVMAGSSPAMTAERLGASIRAGNALRKAFS